MQKIGNKGPMDLDVTSTLREFLEGHSVATTSAGQELAAGQATMAAWIFRKPSTNLANLLQLDVRVNSPLLAGRTLIESFAGWGGSEADAIKQTWQKFAESSLHVLMEVFIGENKGEDQIEWEAWGSARAMWRVCLGPLFAISFASEPLPNLGCGDLLDRLRDALLPTLDKSYHWLRFYYMRQGSSRVGSECLLDNESWPQGQTIVDQWKWPDGSYSVRLFLILVPNMG